MLLVRLRNLSFKKEIKTQSTVSKTKITHNGYKIILDYNLQIVYIFLFASGSDLQNYCCFLCK